MGIFINNRTALLGRVYNTTESYSPTIESLIYEDYVDDVTASYLDLTESVACADSEVITEGVGKVLLSAVMAVFKTFLGKVIIFIGAVIAAIVVAIKLFNKSGSSDKSSGSGAESSSNNQSQNTTPKDGVIGELESRVNKNSAKYRDTIYKSNVTVDGIIYNTLHTTGSIKFMNKVKVYPKALNDRLTKCVDDYVTKYLSALDACAPDLASIRSVVQTSGYSNIKISSLGANDARLQREFMNRELGHIQESIDDDYKNISNAFAEISANVKTNISEVTKLIEPLNWEATKSSAIKDLTEASKSLEATKNTIDKLIVKVDGFNKVVKLVDDISSTQLENGLNKMSSETSGKARELLSECRKVTELKTSMTNMLAGVVKIDKVIKDATTKISKAYDTIIDRSFINKLWAGVHNARYGEKYDLSTLIGADVVKDIKKLKEPYHSKEIPLARINGLERTINLTLDLGYGFLKGTDKMKSVRDEVYNLFDYVTSK